MRQLLSYQVPSLSDSLEGRAYRPSDKGNGWGYEYAYACKKEEVLTGPLSSDEIDALLEKRLIASFASIGSDGKIHLVPMWYKRVEDAVLIPTSSRTRKVRNIRHHPYVSVMIQEARPGLDLKGVLIRGPADVLEGPQAKALNRSIHLRYVTEEGLAQEPVRGYLTNGDDITLRVKMEEMTSWNLTGGEAARALREPGRAHPLD